MSMCLDLRAKLDEIPVWGATKPRQELRGQFLGMTGEHMGREPDGVVDETGWLVGGKLKEPEIRKKRVCAGDLQLRCEPAVVEKKGAQRCSSLGLQDVPADMLVEVAVRPYQVKRAFVGSEPIRIDETPMKRREAADDSPHVVMLEVVEQYSPLRIAAEK